MTINYMGYQFLDQYKNIRDADFKNDFRFPTD